MSKETDAKVRHLGEVFSEMMRTRMEADPETIEKWSVPFLEWVLRNDRAMEWFACEYFREVVELYLQQEAVDA